MVILSFFYWIDKIVFLYSCTNKGRSPRRSLYFAREDHYFLKHVKSRRKKRGRKVFFHNNFLFLSTDHQILHVRLFCLFVWIVCDECICVNKIRQEIRWVNKFSGTIYLRNFMEPFSNLLQRLRFFFYIFFLSLI